MSFPRYSEYKDSGVEWLGEVPTHWKVSALGYRYDISLGKMLDEKRITAENLKPYLRNIDVQWGRINTIDLPMMNFCIEEYNRYSLKRGDLLVCEGGEVGRAAIWQGELAECYYQKALHRLRTLSPSSDKASFFFYVLRCAVDQGAFEALGGKATIAHLPAETFRRQRFPFPPLAEQAAIAAFLDRETAKIDALVAEQERLIELLKEKRQAVISHAVTKGLNPDAPMMDSGIEWLGEVPAHWSIVELRHLVDPSRRITYGIVQPGEADPEGRFMVRGQDYSFGWAAEERIFRVSAVVEEPYRRARLRAGDLLITIVGAGTGNTAIVPEWLDGANITQTTARIAPRTEVVNGPYLQNVLQSIVGNMQILLFQKGAAQPGLNLEHLAAFRIPVPPRREQAILLEHVSSETEGLAGLLAEATSAISLLRERRSALISAAVTGKIDVRGLAPAQAEAA